MRYGIPYMGSKNDIAEWVVGHFPKKENLYDLFAGGCAITHRALLTRKFSNYYINDLDGGVTQLFLDAIAGKYRNETRWVSREDFFEIKEVDPYVKCCWSFGSGGRSYMYGKEIEDYKYCLHQAIVFRNYVPFKERHGIDLSEIDVLNNITSRRLAAKRVIARENKEAERSDTTLQHLENLERLQNLQYLEQLQSCCKVSAIV